ncbi:MAG: hypothetical protein H7321_08055 [Bacteroidia bacterium]|nr:hypothetical protein [Bacteroidia bacterium]
MTTEKKLGIWMDHSTAHLIEFNTEATETQTIESKIHQEEGEHRMSNENVMHNKEQHQQAEYYKKLGETIRNYKDVLLFGPTEAKAELYNTLKDNHLFEKINIAVQQTDKMSETQQQAFVKDYFTK